MRGLVVIALIVLLAVVAAATWTGQLVDSCGRPEISVLLFLLAVGMLSGAKANTKPGCLEFAAMVAFGLGIVVLSLNGVNIFECGG